MIPANVVVGKPATLRNKFIVGYLFVGIHRSHATQIAHLIARESHIVGVLHLHRVAQRVEAHLLGKVYFGLSGFTALGCNHNDTIGTTQSINGRSCRVFQDRDALNRKSVKKREVALHIVDNNQWRTGRHVHRANAADKGKRLRPTGFVRPIIGLHPIEYRSKGILKNRYGMFLQLCSRDG